MTLSSTGTEDDIHRVSSVDSERLINHSSSSIPDEMVESRCDAYTRGPVPHIALPPLLFTDPSHFIVNGTTITRSEVDVGIFGFARHSSALLRDPITSEIVSVTLTILSLPNLDHQVGGIRIGVLDSTAPVPKLGETLGWDVKDSVSLNSSAGYLNLHSPSTQHVSKSAFCHFFLKEGDCVRMEVDMDSTPRTAQFFVNGENGESFVSGLPLSVRIGFSAYGQGTSFRIDRILQKERPTPTAPEMEEIKWE
ncbi:hypothetical protein BLNAU_23930 [Blattamonas nauphoetae]|uniref:Uncharacterized protein n=1 Tax=Blattamonas nauphoetae TaxID=2049346 RepID=A0ABQ9WNW1_9EUKA|nr:hypothetical protein BLNAU_23930 [Blattamonas nauphoetae]